MASYTQCSQRCVCVHCYLFSSGITDNTVLYYVPRDMVAIHCFLCTEIILLKLISTIWIGNGIVRNILSCYYKTTQNNIVFVKNMYIKYKTRVSHAHILTVTLYLNTCTKQTALFLTQLTLTAWNIINIISVSYTHLDVYKRQLLDRVYNYCSSQLLFCLFTLIATAIYSSSYVNISILHRIYLYGKKAG